MSPTPRIYLALVAATLGAACATDVGDPDQLDGDGQADMDDTIVDEEGDDDDGDDDAIDVPDGDIELTAGEVSTSQVCIYEHADYQGRVQCWGGLLPGQRASIPHLFDSEVSNDQAHSFKVKRGFKVQFFNDVDYKGARYSVNGYFGRVLDANMGLGRKPVGGDALSSLKITALTSTARAWSEEDWQVCLYSDADYGGDVKCYGGVPAGKTRGQPTIFHTIVGNDRASSIAVNDGVIATFYSGVDRTGASLTVDGSFGARGVRNLGSSPLGNDTLSSFAYTP
jgi:hypothetical protein